MHFSEKPLTRVVLTEPQPREPCFKPHGLWVSDEDADESWSSWCQAEQFGVQRLAYRTRIHLSPQAQICWIETAESLVRFTDDYGGSPSSLRDLPWGIRQGYGIDWQLVAQDYQGILITPYQWSQRLDERTFWYYGWDVASGCLWDMAAIARVEPLPSMGEP